ncbi:Mn2+/Fe2+ transporter [Oceanobacillus zhaokaii]|uniref:Mn2+/Fe2+ transporter n=1 Tax=Oceanobacillus zhaokaii TaxID=2052660 RepID=A0A345PE57_9BACI|nr:Nramp family divalent metal transporter [Oceanobacillus zhaokaii]AXI08287.1 Mn2+/Fe2+ transporter [Oceanobacillus zhaokaii]
MEPNTNIEKPIETKTGRNSLRKYFLSFGPGIVAVLTMIAAGDLVVSAVSGSNYGYNLMWLLAGAFIIRFVIVNIIARYQLSNKGRLSILAGFAEMGRFIPWFMGIAAIIIGHLGGAIMIIGTGEVLAWLFNFGSPFIWSIVVVLSALFVTGRNMYNTIEKIMKLLLGIMSIAFIGLAIYVLPDVGQIIKGTIGFGIPENTGSPFGVFLVASSLIGAVAGSMTNFLYPYFMKEKGWDNPSFIKLARYDLLFAFFAAAVICLSIWIVGAEILRPNGIQVNNLSDISQALSIYLGPFGSIVFYLGAFGILYSSVIGFANGYPRLAVDCFQIIKKERREKYGDKLENDPWFRWISLFILVAPIVWTIPGMPGFVVMTIFVNAIQTLLVPAIAIGLLVLSNKKSHLGKYTNNWFENVLLVLTTALTVWLSVEWIVDLFL